ncbi:MAG: bifunctional hydroxymethylpyrimidine kinase/phosphomethylpyrimidine kinase [Parerythrobacter sp.]
MTETSVPPRVLIIAGSDSSGGAGIQADIKTVTMLGGYAMTAITAVTAQDTTAVSQIEALSPRMVIAQVDACLSDIGADVIKIGMIGSADTAQLLADRLDTVSGPLVFDPVMVATSGATLADEQTIAAFARLMDLATLVTPNLPELGALAGTRLSGEQDIADAAEKLALRHGCAILVKGGHAESDNSRITDTLFDPGNGIATFEDARFDSTSTHGTGCTLASAIATLLGHGQPMENAVRLARRYVRAGILRAPGFGKGHGPLGHQAVRQRDLATAVVAS